MPVCVDLRHYDIHMAGRYPGAVDLFDPEPESLDREAGQAAFEFGTVDPKVKQCTEDHVAACTRKAIKIQSSHIKIGRIDSIILVDRHETNRRYFSVLLNALGLGKSYPGSATNGYETIRRRASIFAFRGKRGFRPTDATDPFRKGPHVSNGRGDNFFRWAGVFCSACPTRPNPEGDGDLTSRKGTDIRERRNEL